MIALGEICVRQIINELEINELEINELEINELEINAELEINELAKNVPFVSFCSVLFRSFF